MNILFRVDSSSTIGLGHLMRCLVLAEQYKNDEVIFACQDLAGNVNNKIIEKKYQLITLKNHQPDELIQVIESLSIDMIVFDHYGIDYSFEKEVKQQTKVKILSLDDTYQKHYCDILLNHNIYAKKEQYKNLVPDFCELKCGQKYTLIRDEFKEISYRKRTINKKNPNVFVAMGGADSQNISLLVLKILVKFKQLTINVATTKANQNIVILQDFIKQYSQVNIHIDNENIAQLMDSSDFAIITPSVIVYEAMYLNLPFIAIQTADNQQYIYKYLIDNNFLAIANFKGVVLNKIIKKCLC